MKSIGFDNEKYLKAQTEMIFGRQPRKVLNLDLEQTLIALSISATTNLAARIAMKKLKELNGCEVHITHIPTPGDEQGLRKIGVNLTSDPISSSNSMFIA